LDWKSHEARERLWGGDLPSEQLAHNEKISLDSLSARERQILGMAATGMLDKQIGPELGVSLNTLRTYWGRIRTKTGNFPRTVLAAAYVANEIKEELVTLGPVAHEGWVIDVQSMMLMASDSINDLHGLECGVPHPVPAYSLLYHPEDKEMAQKAIHRVISGDLESTHVIFRLALESGVEVINLMVRGEKDQSGKTVKVVGYRTRTLDCRADRDPQVRIGTWRRDVSANSLTVDDDFCEIVGIDRDVPDVMEAILNSLHPEDRETVRDFALKAALRGESSVQCDARVVKDDGSVVWVRTKARIERDLDGSILILGTVAAFR